MPPILHVNVKAEAEVGGFNSRTLTYDLPVALGSVLVAAGWYRNTSSPGTAPSLSDSVNGAWSTPAVYRQGTTDTALEIFIGIKTGSAAGTPTVTLDPPGATADLGGWCILEVQGAEPSSSAQQSSTTEVFSTNAPSLAMETLAQPEEWAISVLGTNVADELIVLGGPWTKIVESTVLPLGSVRVIRITDGVVVPAAWTLIGTPGADLLIGLLAIRAKVDRARFVGI